MIKAKTFEDAFLMVNHEILNQYKFNTTSRIGDMYEILSLSYLVEDPSSYKFENENIGRIDYQYANDFYEWMTSGSTDVEALASKYPNVARFLDKPKSEHLPDNFNTFYGPRIAAQLPIVFDELKKENSRRCVISILDADDLLLLDKDETLEFPCADSCTFNIRENRLYAHLHMRSQNCAQVMKLDMYLWGRFTTELAKELNVELGDFTSTIVSAHVFNRDLEYIKQFLK